jgi:outer membrane protein assembly factor BamB
LKIIGGVLRLGVRNRSRSAQGEVSPVVNSRELQSALRERSRAGRVALSVAAFLILAACDAEPVVDPNDVPPDVSGADLVTKQPGYRASLYPTAWPADMANLNRSNTAVSAGLPKDFKCDEVRVDTVEMPFPVFAYTRNADEVFVLGGLPWIVAHYDAEIDGMYAGWTSRNSHLTKYNPFTGETKRLALTKGYGFPYIGGALVHENGYVYVVSQAYIYKINPDTMTIAAGAPLPLAPWFGKVMTIYNGLSTSKSGMLLTKFFSPFSKASTFFSIDPDTLKIVATVNHPGDTPRLTVDKLANGDEYLYHLTRENTFRFRIDKDSLTPDKEWVSRFDPYGNGGNDNAEPTSPVIVNGRVHYTTNTLPYTDTPMRIFWQETEKKYVESDPPLPGQEMLQDVKGPGWNFFHLSIDDISGTIVGMDQKRRMITALRIRDDGTLEHIWQKSLTVSARPVIVSDRGQVYATDFVDGKNHLVVLDLSTGEEICRVATAATRATISTMVVSTANEVYFGSNEPGKKTGLFHRFYIP